MGDVVNLSGRKSPSWSKVYPFTRTITVRTQFRGFHTYENAPDQVAFLKNSHRHVFKVSATISVNHDDRDLEFFMVQDVLDKQIMPFIQMGNLGSCEMIAERIATGLINTYGTDRNYKVTVSEDGENDGTVQFDRVRYAIQQTALAMQTVPDHRYESIHGQST